MAKASIRIAVLCLSILAIVSPRLMAQSPNDEIERDAQIRKFIFRGDFAYHKFANKEALGRYHKALDLNPGEYTVLWRISRVQVEIGEHEPKAVQLPYYEEALQFAEQAILANPDGWEGYTYRAISFGKMALHKGVWTSIGIAKQIKKDCEKALELNPDNHIAMYMLGRTHQKIAEKGKLFRIPLGLGWASMEKAKRFYEAALTYRPELVVYNIDYARLLIDLEQSDEARIVLQRIANMPIVDQDDEWNKGNAVMLLQELESK